MSTSRTYDEKELLLRISTGEESAFRELVLRYSGLVFKFIFQHVNDRPLSEEIVQDIFLKVWQARETLAEVQSLKSYLFIISRNHAFNAIKKMIRERRREWDWLQEGTMDRQLAVEHPGIDADREFLYTLIDEAVDKLPSQQKKAWIYCRRQGLKYEETAQKMDISKEAVKKYLQIANNSIKEYVFSRAGTSLLLLIIWGS